MWTDRCDCCDDTLLTGGCLRCQAARTFCCCGALLSCGCGRKYMHERCPLIVTVPTVGSDGIVRPVVGAQLLVCRERGETSR
jgi:hypothetical protein